MIYELRKITNTWDGIRTTPLEVGKKSPISGGLKMRVFSHLQEALLRFVNCHKTQTSDGSRWLNKYAVVRNDHDVNLEVIINWFRLLT